MIYICIRELYSVFFNNNKFSICSYDEEVNHMLMVLMANNAIIELKMQGATQDHKSALIF